MEKLNKGHCHCLFYCLFQNQRVSIKTNATSNEKLTTNFETRLCHTRLQWLIIKTEQETLLLAIVMRLAAGISHVVQQQLSGNNRNKPVI